MMRFLMVVLMLSASLSGCLADELVPMDDDPCIGTPVTRADDGTLRILTYDITAFSDTMLTEFTEQSGYDVELMLAEDAGGILERMLQTQTAPQADVAVGLDNTYLQTAIDFCLLTPHDVSTDAVDDVVMAMYDGPLAVPFDQGHVCLNYDETAVDGENLTAPTSLWNLTEVEWKGKTVFPSPLTSSPGRAFMVATIDYFENDGDANTTAFDWWKAMAENDAVFTTGWTEAYETYYTGGYGPWTDGHLGGAALTVSYCHSPGVEAFYGENWTISTSLVLPRATFHQVEYGGLVNGGANSEAANAFLTYLLSEEVNRNMPENNLMKSVLHNATWPETAGYGFHTDEPTQNANVSNVRMGEEMAEWLVAWSLATQ
jgi:thiamine transport system substrate-binding protein